MVGFERALIGPSKRTFQLPNAVIMMIATRTATTKAPPGSIAQTKGVSIQESSELKLDRLHFRHKPICVVTQVSSDNIEHRVTEATDVQDVAPFRSLRRSVRLNVDADQLRSLDVSALEPNLILHELLPFGHYACRAVCTVRERTVGVDPALVVADQHAARKLSLAVPSIGFAKWD